MIERGKFPKELTYQFIFCFQDLQDTLSVDIIAAHRKDALKYGSGRRSHARRAALLCARPSKYVKVQEKAHPLRVGPLVMHLRFDSLLCVF